MTAKTAKTKATTENSIGADKAIAHLQDQANAVYAKGASAVRGINDLTKGNVEAVVESGKILGAGFRELTTGYVAATCAAFDTTNAEIKGLTAIKSPADLFKIQANIVLHGFNAAMSLSSQNAETILKFFKEAATPLVERVNVVADPARTAA